MSHPLLTRAARLFLALNQWSVILALAAMAVIVFTNVTLRYLTSTSIIWAEEVSRYLMIYMAFLSAGLALRQGLLVAITQTHLRFPPAHGRAVRLVMLLVMLGFCLWMVWSGLEYTQRMGRQVTPATRISFGWIYQAMPLGFGLMAVHLLMLWRQFITMGRFDDGHDQPSMIGG